MKKMLFLSLLFALALPIFGQKDRKSPTTAYLQEKDPTFIPKISKNEFSCDFEFPISLNLTFKRRLSDKFSIGITGKLVGFAGGILYYPEHNNFEGGLDVINLGILFDFKISNRFYLELSPQYKGFFDGVSDSFETTFSIYGISSGFYVKIKKFSLGTTMLIGRVSGVYATKLAIYNSLIILRFPLRNNQRN